MSDTGMLLSAVRALQIFIEGRLFRFLLAAVIPAGCAMAFGVPSVPDMPDIPDADISDIEIPVMELLDEVQVKLNGILSETDTLRTLIPDLAALNDFLVKLEELRYTDTELPEIQRVIDRLCSELEDAQAQSQASLKKLMMS